MVDMGDDGEVADVGNRDGCHGRGIALAPPGGNHIALFLQASSRQADSTSAQNALRTAACPPHRFYPRPRARDDGLRSAGWRRGWSRNACDPKAGLWLVIGFAAAHAVLWTLILVNLKAAQDVHMDVAEAFAWGQKFQFGYGKHPPLAGLGRRSLVQGFSGRRLGDLRAGDGDARLWSRDLLADRPARGGSPPRVLRRGDARALSDLQLQGFQVQSGPAAAGDVAAAGAGLSARVREAQRAGGPVARASPARWR